MKKTIHYRDLSIDSRLAAGEARTVDAALSSTEPVERIFGFEVLSHETAAVDLSRSVPSLPLLFNHNTDEPIGSCEGVRIEGGKLRARLRFAKTARGDEYFSLVRDGHIHGISIGYFVDEVKQTGEREGIPVFTATKWRLLEASVAPVPADHLGAGVGRSISINNFKGEKMETIDNESRAATLVELGEQYSKYVTRKDVTDAVRGGASVEQFKETILTKMQSRHTTTAELHIGMEGREVQRYSIARAVVATLTGDWNEAGLERSASEAVARILGKKPTGFYVPYDIFRRDFNVGTSSEAGNLVATELRNDMFVDVLRNNLVISRLGVRILSGLSGNIDIPKKVTTSSISRVTEIQALTESNPTTGKLSLTPHRFGGYVDYSRQALIQSGIAIEPMLRDDLLTSGMVDLQDQIVNGSGSGANIRGIRNTSGIGSVAGGTNGAAPAWSHIVDLESQCANANAEPADVAGYLVNTKTRGKLKQTVKGTNLPFIWDNGATPLNGYRAAVTNTVPSNLTKGTSTTVCSSIIFGSDWSMAVLGIFGAPDITIDPYTLATTGQIRITFNQYADFGVRQAACFASMEDAVTS